MITTVIGITGLCLIVFTLILSVLTVIGEFIKNHYRNKIRKMLLEEDAKLLTKRVEERLEEEHKEDDLLSEINIEEIKQGIQKDLFEKE